MDTFVKGGNEMWKMPEKKQYQNQQCLPHTEHVQVKINIILKKMCQNISGENLRLSKSKMLSIFGST